MMIFLPELKGLNDTVLYFDEKKLQDKTVLCRKSLENSAGYELEADTVLLDSFHSATIEGAEYDLFRICNIGSKPAQALGDCR